MIGDYNLEHITYGVRYRGVQLVDLVEAPLDKYVGKIYPLVQV